MRHAYLRKLNSKVLWLWCLSIFLSLSSYAQNSTLISGQVNVEGEADPVPGISVLVKGTQRGTVTDLDGSFQINAAPGETLVVSYIGYETQEITLTPGQTSLSITLAIALGELGEVVVMGYGSQRRADITSAVSVIDMEAIGDVPVSNASRLLQGQAAGVQVRQTSGTPGQDMEVTIRGIGSLGAGSAPLYVIDGFPVGSSIGQNLNPNDIESISVLKDAASTAIYGARGSNGVILITTKSAKDGEVSLNFTANYGVQNVPQSRRTQMMNGVEFAQFKKESFMDRIRYYENREPSIEEVPLSFRYPEETKYSTDWFDEITRDNAAFQDYNITFSSGKGDIRTLLSVGYLNQEGAVIETGFERFNVRANLDGKINDFVAMGWNIAGTRSKEEYANSYGRDATIGRALWLDPRYPVYNEDGTYLDFIGGEDGAFGSVNPVQELRSMIRDLYKTTLVSNGYLEFSFLKDFKFRTSVNVELENISRKEFRPSFLAGPGFDAPPPREATLGQEAQEILNVAADQLLSYTKNLENHRFDALVGFSAQEETWKYLSGSGNEFPNDLIPYLNSAIRKNAGSGEAGWSLMAYFARLNYSYLDKYLLSASFRREGSSRFGINNKWGNFPAASIGWRISEESFMPETNWLTDLKVRASYGVTGNNDIGNYTSLSNLATSNYIFGNAIANGQVLAAFANADLGWEQSEQLDIGLDLALFDNKVIFTAEYYERITKDMLLSVEIPVISGFTRTISNVGKVQNRGVELALDYRTRFNQVNFRSNFNISFNRNKVLEIQGDTDAIWNGGMYSTYNVSRVGRPIGMLTGFRMMGIFNTQEEIDAWPTQDGAIPGVYKYFDANGDGEISYDQQDMIEIGNPHPKFIYALNLGADYKNFDLSLMFTGAHDYDVFRNIEATTMNMDGVFNILKSGVNRWRSAENPGDGRGATTNTWKWERESNSRYVYDASHIWLKNISLGYAVPANAFMKNARLFVSAENLFLITDFPGSNPEVNNRGGINPGVDDEVYPVPRTFTVGATIGF
jgi:TonB-linked SusC/RagA family outer membrane protein